MTKEEYKALSDAGVVMRKNKFIYEWVIQGYYGYGWEDLSVYDKNEYSYADVKHDIKEYRIADSAPIRLIERRELNKE